MGIADAFTAGRLADDFSGNVNAGGLSPTQPNVKAVQTVADLAAISPVPADKSSIYVEDEGNWYFYDAQSNASPTSGSPTAGDQIVKPDGVTLPATGRYVALDPMLMGAGDMLKSTYDTNSNNIVDNSEALGGNNSAYHLDRANHTGTQTAATISDFDTEVAGNTDVAANTAARHDALTLDTDLDTTLQAAALVGQELELKKATASTDGVMSAEDKAKLDNLTSYTEVADKAARLAQTGITNGTLTRQTDNGNIYILTDETGIATDANWYPLLILEQDGGKFYALAPDRDDSDTVKRVELTAAPAPVVADPDFTADFESGW